MRRFPVLPLLVLAALVSPAGAAGKLEVLASDATGVDLQWTLDRTALETVPGVDRTFQRPAYPGGFYIAEPGAPDLPSIVELVGIPLEGEPRIRVLSVDPATIPVPDLAPAPMQVVRTAARGKPFGVEERRLVEPFPPGTTPSRWAEIDDIVMVRGHRLARVVLHPWRYDASRGEVEWARHLRVRVEFEGASPGRGEEVADHAEWDRMLDGLILNADAARGWRRPAKLPVARGTTDSFDSSPNWLKVPIVTEGIYRIDYSTFADLGFDPGGIDPRTIRVFSGTNMMIPDEMTELPLRFMSECSLLDVSASPDGIFDIEDRLLFYALDATGWGSEYDASLPRDQHVENQYTDVVYYWITWGGNFTNPPARMTSRSVAPSGGPYSFTADHRVHFEENNLEDFRYPGEDGWMWDDLEGRSTDRPYFLTLDGVASGDGTVIARILSHGELGTRNLRRVELKLQNTIVGNAQWLHAPQSAVFDVTSDPITGLLREGSNTLLVNAVTSDPGASDQLYTAWFEVEYERRLDARNGSYIKMWADSASGPWELRDFSSPGVILLDATDQHAVVQLEDAAVENLGPSPWRVRFSEPQTTTAHWYVAFTMESVRTLPVPDIEIASFFGADGLKSLRSSDNGADYVIIYHPAFREGADRLARLRGQRSPADTSSLDVMAVSIADIYNEFSWGMTDAVAIRDFLAFTTVGWTQGSPLWVTLVGDASYDLKGFLDGSPTNYIPPYVNRYRTESFNEYETGFNLNFYSTDDFFAYLDVEDYTGTGQPAMDLAVGRYPVWNTHGLDVMLDKLESYLAYSMPGQWQNRVILSADDERVLAGIDPTQHTTQVEDLAQGFLPPALDRVKVYLTEYPRDDFGKKPEAQTDFTEEFTRGALMVTYSGHGDQNTLAQEEVFVSQKMSELLNEERYPVFSTFSCTVSRFDLLSGDSMTELMLLHEGGGTVSTFSSGGLVFPAESSSLNKAWLGEMFGTPYVVHSYSREVRSIGEAAWHAKVQVGFGSIPRRRINNEKYVVLGDPALKVRLGRYLIEFESSTVDSQTTDGLLRLVRGDLKDSNGQVLDGTNGEAPFQGTAFVHVTENADTSGYLYADGSVFLPYELDGPTSYRGEVPVVNGHFDARFFLSETVTIGNRGRISVFALEHDLKRDASGAHDSLVIAPTISPQDTDDAVGPVIRIGFEGYEGFVDGGLVFTDQPILDIELEDPSGINLRPVPQFAVLGAQIDGLEQVALSEDFTYDEGSYTKGRVRRILPLPAGPHTLEVKAFDNVANRGSASVRFEIVAPGSGFDLDGATVAAYPNPFQNQVHFVFRMNEGADVALKIFTITGRKVFERTEAFPGPPLSEYSIRWDGRDQDGTPLANGTYLYKLEATHRAQSGESQKDEFVGKVVRMQ